VSRDALRDGVRGRPALTGRLEPWMRDLLADPEACDDLVESFGSPVNVIDPGPLSRNAAELQAAAGAHGVPLKVFFARKANKALSLVAAAERAGHGVDVASLAELRQVLDAGVPGDRVVLTAAVKSRVLLEAAVGSGVAVAADTVEELAALAVIAGRSGRPARVLVRLAPDPSAGLPPTRFGEPSARWLAALSAGPDAALDVVGVHVHLHGYRVDHRLSALAECLDLVDALAANRHAPRAIDLGGGVPMSYLDDAGEWREFWKAMEVDHPPESLTWKDAELANVYPFHAGLVRGDWLDALLGATLPGRDATAAEELRRRDLTLHLEPGRTLLDGCGVTIARVAFVKCRSDGVPLVGLEMNRTQLRSTSDDVLTDPLLVRRGRPGPELDGFLVGAYCIEDEVILKRRLHFPSGVAAGDLVVFVNTAGYLMHILESASHQIPLAANIVHTDNRFELDPIDGPASKPTQSSVNNLD
jgi:diaminopimelate decarboxylase